jgi:RHS repeat-associated protein
MKKVESGVTVFYVRSSVMKQTAFEVGGNGALYRANVYAGSQTLIGQLSPDGQFYWQHTNHLGSVHKLTSSSGAVVYRGEYDPHGNVLLETGSTMLNSHKFTGYEKDQSTGLDYAEARMYAGSRGRFTTPDPQWLSAASARRPQTLNRYSYVNNDPVNFVDRTGLGDCGFLICDSITVNGSTNDDPNTVPGVVSSIGTGTGLDHDQAEEDSSGGAGETQNVSLAPLTPQQLKALSDSLDKLIEFLSEGTPSEKCKTNVLDKLTNRLPGFNWEKFVSFLRNGFNAYDDPSSTVLAIGALATADQNKEFELGYENKTVGGLFSRGGSYTGAITSITGPKLTVFFEPGTIEGWKYGGGSQSGAALWLHEALHGYGAYAGIKHYGDGVLADALGIDDNADSSEITKVIRENCF